MYAADFLIHFYSNQCSVLYCCSNYYKQQLNFNGKLPWQDVVQLIASEQKCWHTYTRGKPMSHNRLLDPNVILPGPRFRNIGWGCIGNQCTHPLPLSPCLHVKKHGDLGIGWAMRAMGIDSNTLLYGDLEVGQWEVELGRRYNYKPGSSLRWQKKCSVRKGVNSINLGLQIFKTGTYGALLYSVLT